MARKLLRFTKVQGTGNDMIIVNGMNEQFHPTKDNVRYLCDRRLGIGADQLLLLLSSKKADFRLRIFNRDGSEAEMCGNGLRCVAKYLIERKLTPKRELAIETLSGIVNVWARGGLYTVDMGKPLLDSEDIPVKLKGMVINRNLTLKDKNFKITCVNMGNPHCVTFVDNVEKYPVRIIGPLIEKHALFPAGVNVEFVEKVSNRELKVRVWERGTGETLACGSGACAALIASILNGKTDRSVKVNFIGGTLHLKWDRDEHVYLTGPAVEVYNGEIQLKG